MKGKAKDGFVRRRDHVVWKVIEGKGILLNLEDGAYFDVDPVGLAIWQLCDGKTTLSQISNSINLKFQTDLEKIRRDVSQFTDELKRQRLVEIISTPNRAIARA